MQRGTPLLGTGTPLGWALTRTPQRLVVITGASKSKKKQREYGSGRQQFGLEGGDGGSPSSAPPGTTTTLKEYLQFGKLIGERAQDVKQQLQLNGVDVVVDKASQAMLDELESEQMTAYSMFEALLDDVPAGQTLANPNSTLARNKNRAVRSVQSTAKFIERQGRPREISAADRKLAKARASYGTRSAAAMDATPGFELVASSSSDNDDAAAVPSLDRPSRPGAPFSPDDEEDAWASCSDEEWDELVAEDSTASRVTVGPPPSYDDFEAALNGTGPRPPKPAAAAAAAATSRPGAVRLSLADAPKRPRAPKLGSKEAAALPQSLQLSPPPQTPGQRSRAAAQAAAPPPPERKAPLPAPNLSQKPPRPAEPEQPEEKDSVQVAAAAAAAPVVPDVKPTAPKPRAPVVSAAPAQPLKAAAPQKPAAAAAAVVPKPAQQPAQRPVPHPVQDKNDSVPEASVTAAAAAPADPAAVPSPLSPSSLAVQKEKAEEKAEPVAAAAAAATAELPSALSKPARPELRSPTASPQRPDRSGLSEEDLVERKQKSVAAAAALLAARGHARVAVWGNNSAGVLVRGGAIYGFVPLSELGRDTVAAVLAQERLLAEQDPAAPKQVLRRGALRVLKGQELVVEVVSADPESGAVVLSERLALRSLQLRPGASASEKAVAAAREMVNHVVPVTVRSVRPFGLFVEFSVETSPGQQEDLFGLVHTSELSWDAMATAGENAPFAPGQQINAKITHVDLRKGRVFLSVRRATPSPLLQTLDSLLSTTPAATADAGSPRRTIDAAEDLRPLLGDLDVAEWFADAMVEEEGVVSASIGVRLQSKASSPGVEVYLSKGDSAAAAAAAEGGDEKVAGRQQTFKLVLRKGQDVQEVELVSVLPREEVRQLAALTVARWME